LFPDVVASAAFPGGINTLVALLGNGDGTFATPRFYAAGLGGAMPPTSVGQIPPSLVVVGSDPFIPVTTFTVLTTLVRTNLIANGNFEKQDLANEKGNTLGWQMAHQVNSHGEFLLQSGSTSPYSDVGVPQPPQGQYAIMLDEPNTLLPFDSALGGARIF